MELQMKYASIINILNNWRKKMSEIVNTAPKAWMTDGVESVMIFESDLEMFLAASPGWRRGRTLPKKKEDEVVNTEIPVQQPKPTPVSKQVENNLYLVVGTVRMDPLIPGRGGAQADQHRLVWASNVQEAMAKYQRYFDGLNNHAERYTVINMAVSEAII
jgi:hypothetical protein